MVLNNTNDGEWVAFNKDADSSGFEAIARPSSKLVRLSNHAVIRRKSDRRSSGSKDDSISVATWMKKPINSDASWAPVAAPPPAFRSSAKDEHPVASKKRPPKHLAKSTAPTLDGPNPVSSSSESSSSASGQQRRSRSISRTSRSSQRGNSRPRSTAPPSINVPLKSQSSIRSKSPSIISKKESSGNGKEPSPSSRRGRSRTRNPGETTKVIQQSSTTATAVASRGRSISQSRISQRERSSSATSRRSSTKNTVQVSGTKIRTGGRPPITSPRAGGTRPPVSTGIRRSRSTSRNASPRSRSVSRTRSQSRNPSPSTLRTRKEVRNPVHGSNSVGGSLPQRRGPSSG
ncbi:MAG: hypothetical protein ACI90V_004718, partial [Bacillariaceae sp.]